MSVLLYYDGSSVDQVLGLNKEGGASRETPDRDSYRHHRVQFNVRRTGLESIHFG